MIIETLFCSLKESLMDTDLFRVGYEYVELIKRNSTSGASTIQPMYYEGGGYKPVQNLDVGGMFYIRKNGNTSLSADTKTMQPTPCDPGTAVVMTVPIRVVSAVLRENFESHRFADDMLCSVIITALQGSSLSATDLNAKFISMQTGATNTDSYQIWAQENPGITFKESDFIRFAYVSVDFIITINTDTSCLSSCQNEY